MVPDPFIMTDTISSCTLGVIKGAINRRMFNIYDFLCYDFKVSKNIKTLRALSIFLIILLPFLSLEVCGLSEGKVLIQLSYGNVTTFDMGGQHRDVSQIKQMPVRFFCEKVILLIEIDK